MGGSVCRAEGVYICGMKTNTPLLHCNIAKGICSKCSKRKSMCESFFCSSLLDIEIMSRSSFFCSQNTSASTQCPSALIVFPRSETIHISALESITALSHVLEVRSQNSLCTEFMTRSPTNHFNAHFKFTGWAVY